MRSEFNTRWVFIRGLVRESTHWNDFPERFAECMPDAEVVKVDLPGNGRYCDLSSPLSLTGAMEFVRTEIAQSGAGEQNRPALFLFSISLGSMVAIEWIHRHPDEVAGAVLLNTSLRKLSPFYQRLRWQAWPELLRIVLERDVAARERRILDLTTGPGGEVSRWVDVWVNAYREHPVRRVNVLRQLIAAARYAPPPSRPSAPVLLLSGQADRLVDPRCTEAIARCWSLAYRSHPTAGHDLSLDAPDWTIDAVRQWLGNLADRATAVSFGRP